MADNSIVEHGKLTFIGKFIIPWAIKYRNNLVLKYIRKYDASLLDVGGEEGI
ncbi:hypothetical protein J4457_01755 [Candidatus Woesearchaeota archaeon]|nr:hypothetical protein [Candidatus Woesearchaeota archaeon]